MIEIKENLFCLHTRNTSYLMAHDEAGNLLHLYYGNRLFFGNMPKEALLYSFLPRSLNPNGTSIAAFPEDLALCLDDLCLEISTRGKGDMGTPFVEVHFADGSSSSDFRFENAELIEDIPFPKGLPGAYVEEAYKKETLLITLKEAHQDLFLDLYYTVYEDCDCITRYASLRNESSESVHINRLMSAQLDLRLSATRITSFHGEWAREMDRHDLLLTAGRFVNESTTGFSSNKANPFVMYASFDTTEDHGPCYASNLFWSGNHMESAEINGHGRCRILTGLHPDSFSWTLPPKKSFDSPEAVLSFSEAGYGGISQNMHRFVREHVVRGGWKKKERPILINSWEAMYFKLSEKKLLKLADAAKKVGIELFVMDDGWFGKRDDDTSSLGDWFDNTKKLPGGIKGISEKIKEKGLLFGIWVEPEMVNEDSDLYRAHPDWAVKIPDRHHATGRNQMLLDLTRSDVRDYIIESMSDVFSRSAADYVKWDMNRHMSDFFSNALPADRQQEFSYRYIRGLYEIFSVLTERFPNILFEGCASGGNRFDLGILSYFPQIWASDNTDAISRCRIQNGYSYGYPQSVISAHVSSAPNHQTLRVTSLDTRYSVASAGILGYELNLCDQKAEILAEIKDQVEIYKRYRKTLQFGNFYRIEKEGDFDTSLVRWIIVSEDKKEALAIMVNDKTRANLSYRYFRSKGLADEKIYHFFNLPKKEDVRRMGDLINTAIPVHIRQESMVHHLAAKFYKLDGEKEDLTITGSILNHAGIPLSPNYAGTGLEAGTALYQDHDARIYYMIEEEH